MDDSRRRKRAMQRSGAFATRATESVLEPWAALAQRLERPIYNRTVRREIGHGDTDYEIYLKTARLLDLQTPRATRVHQDELVFQIVHQAQELWLRLVAEEAVELVRRLDADETWSAQASLERMVRAMCALAAEIHVLETVTPAVFQVIRRNLGNGSGLESPGYNALHESMCAVGQALERATMRRGTDLASIYGESTGANEDLLRVCEMLVDIDGWHQRWLTAHFILVRRTIGVDRTVKALDGFPTHALPARMIRPLFPVLWDLRVEMTRTWQRAGGYTPGEERFTDAPSPSVADEPR